MTTKGWRKHCSAAALAFAAMSCSPAATEREAKASVAKSPTVAPAAPAPGCDSGLRDGFADPAQFPKIAACAGSWDAPGLLSDDTSRNTASALCAAGWHICSSLAEVARKSAGKGCAGGGLQGDAFFATREGATSPAECFTRGEVGLLGCGGGAPAPSACSPLDRVSNPGCSALGKPWACEKGNELASVTKGSHDGGGVLCCEGQGAPVAQATTQPWSFGGGAPYVGNGHTPCGALSLSSTNTEPWGDGAFRNVPGKGASVVILTFDRPLSAFHLRVRLSGTKAYLAGFNVPPSRVTGASFDGKEVRPEASATDAAATLSWFGLDSGALSWVLGGKERSTVWVEGYGLSCD